MNRTQKIHLLKRWGFFEWNVKYNYIAFILTSIFLSSFSKIKFCLLCFISSKSWKARIKMHFFRNNFVYYLLFIYLFPRHYFITTLSSSKNSRELLCRYGSNLNVDSKYGILKHLLVIEGGNLSLSMRKDLYNQNKMG